jgi:hypothetical protein
MICMFVKVDRIYVVKKGFEEENTINQTYK